MSAHYLIRLEVIATLLAMFSAPVPGAGLEMQADPRQLEVSLHEPVVVKITLRNPTEDSVTVDLGVDFVTEFHLTVTGPDGRRRPLPALTAPEFGAGGNVRIAPLASYARPLILSEWSIFESPGYYRVEIGLPGVASFPSVGVTILPRDPDRLRTVCGELARNALEARTYTDAWLFARALSVVVDDEAIPYLRKVADESDALAPFAFSCLTRIADRAAVRALQSLCANPNKDISQGARGSLGVIRHSTRDESLKQEIDAFLAKTAH